MKLVLAVALAVAACTSPAPSPSGPLLIWQSDDGRSRIVQEGPCTVHEHWVGDGEDWYEDEVDCMGGTRSEPPE